MHGRGRALPGLCLALALTLALTLALEMSCAAPVSAQDAPAAGHVQAVTGDVRILSPERGELPATLGLAVYAQDEVATGPGGWVQIQCADQSLVALSQESRLRMGEVLHDPQRPGDAIFNLEVLKGAAGLVSGAVARDNPDGFQVSTPLSYIGIRGTEFAVLVEPGQEVHGLLYGGPVAVTSRAAESAGQEGVNQAALCAALAEALNDYQRSARLYQDQLDFAGKREAQQRAETAQELMDAHGCSR